MLLIDEVEISYFRSIYKARIRNLNELNIIFGRNDVGKSNVLRALNLFFNGETIPGTEFDFQTDFSTARRSEAESKDIKKFVYVKVTFNTPSGWRKSLGHQFFVKKQWSITKQREPTTTNNIKKKNERYLTQFLEKIRYHYIPAIKDRSIFEYLQSEIYDVISNHAEFAESLSTFADTLEARTGGLSQGILSGLGINSVIAPPSDLTELFKSLDFETRSDLGDSYSLKNQRGDGIQVRHIPEVLSFVSDEGPDEYHIWGFEEPENSLEIANAIDEAEAFCRHAASRNKQIFLTSHSPAFFSLKKPTVLRLFVKKESSDAIGAHSEVEPIGEQSPYELMGELPHLTIISEYLQDAAEKIEGMKAAQSELEQRLSDLSRPTLFVEGESDKVIFEAAIAAFFPDGIDIEVKGGGGTSKMESLAKNGKTLSELTDGKEVFVIVDNDREGRELYRNGRLREGGRWVTHNSNGTHWCLLPLTAELLESAELTGIPRSKVPGCLENLFSLSLRSRAIEEGVYRFGDRPHAELLGDPELVPLVYGNESNPLEKMYNWDLHEGQKVPFAHWIAENSQSDPSILAPLQVVIQHINDVLSGD